MIDTVIHNLTNPNSITNIVVVMLALFAKDLVVALLRAASVRILTDKNKKNDHLADVATAVADSLEKLPTKIRK